MTPYEYIKNMNPDELADYFAESLHCDGCLAEEFCNKINDSDNDELIMKSCRDRFKLWLETPLLN